MKSVVMMLPASPRKTLAKALWGWEVSITAQIRPSIFDCTNVVIGEHTRIGFGNRFLRMHRLLLSDRAEIRNSNTFSGATYQPSILHLESQAQIMSHHFLDLTGNVTLGRGSILAGRWTAIWTHGRRPGAAVDNNPNWARVMDVRIGPESVVGAGSIIVLASTTAGTYLGAGSVLTHTMDKQNWVYAGNPARPQRDLGSPARPSDAEA